MINLSEAFQFCGQGNCMDVASSLGLQGVNNFQDVSIPIYGPFFLKILTGGKAGFICGNIQENSVLQHLNASCGTVAITINLLEMDMLTLVGGLLAFTPRTGMNVFLKPSAVELVDNISDLLPVVANLAGLTIPDMVFESEDLMIEFGGKVIQALFDMLIDALDKDLGSCGITIREWAEIPNFYNDVRNSGELQQMLQFRRQMGCPTF